MLLAVAEVCVADVLYSFPAVQLDTLSDKGPSAVTAAEQSTVTQDRVPTPGTDTGGFALGDQVLYLPPHFFRDDGREEVLMAELLLRLRKSKGLVDLVPLTLVADQCAGVDLIL